jgi:hypothetical protein
MRSHAGRTYAAAAALLLFFLAWAAIAARPWAKAASDSRLAQLAVREQQLRREGVLVRKIVQQRWALYRTHLAARKRAIAAAQAQQRRLAAVASAAPSGGMSYAAVRVVTLPALTITRTS